MKKKNLGMSFIELILALAIASILAGAAIYSLGHSKDANVKACVNDINSMMDKVRISSMSKDPKPGLYIYWYNNAYYMKQAVNPTLSELDDSGTLISRDNVRIKGVVTGASGGAWTVQNGLYLTVKFKRSNGALDSESGPFVNGRCIGYDYIEVSDLEGKIVYDINIVGLTGKHYIVRK